LPARQRPKSQTFPLPHCELTVHAAHAPLMQASVPLHWLASVHAPHVPLTQA